MSSTRKNYKTAKDFYYPVSEEKQKVRKETNRDVSLEWSVKKYESSANPEVWGPAFWFSLHNGAARYPLKASPITKERMKGFILGLPVMIPCLECKEHTMAYVEGNFDRLDDVCSGRVKLFNFFVDLHNKVNERYNKPIMGYEEAYALYTGSAAVSKLSYN